MSLAGSRLRNTSRKSTCYTGTMSQPLVPYNTEAQPLRSQLLVAPPDPVPSVEELEATQAELKALKQRVLERARKAAGDLKIIENEMKKMRDLEKGKARALPLHKVKREPSCKWNIVSFLSCGWALTDLSFCAVLCDALIHILRRPFIRVHLFFLSDALLTPGTH